MTHTLNRLYRSAYHFDKRGRCVPRKLSGAVDEAADSEQLRTRVAVGSYVDRGSKWDAATLGRATLGGHPEPAI